VYHETFVRFGKRAWRSIAGPIAGRSSSSSSSSEATRIAHCGLPIETCWKAQLRPSVSSVAAPSSGPPGKSFDASRARPMSTVQVVSPVIVGRISPAAVWIEKTSLSVQPRRRR
jgi:hypothetical protein